MHLWHFISCLGHEYGGVALICCHEVSFCKCVIRVPSLAGDVNTSNWTYRQISSMTLWYSLPKINVSGKVALTVIGNKFTAGKDSTATLGWFYPYHFLYLYPCMCMHCVAVKCVFSL
jgi:hypothetical protein